MGNIWLASKAPWNLLSWRSSSPRPICFHFWALHVYLFPFFSFAKRTGEDFRSDSGAQLMDFRELAQSGKYSNSRP